MMPLSDYTHWILIHCRTELSSEPPRLFGSLNRGCGFRGKFSRILEPTAPLVFINNIIADVILKDYLDLEATWS